MTDPLWVGVDIGTQSARVGIFGHDGRARARASHRLAEVRSGSRHTQDPHDWISATLGALAAALTELPGPERRAIAGLAICSTSGTFAVNHEGAWSEGLMYDDARATDLVDLVRDADSAHWGRGGVPAGGSWALAKFRWLAENGGFAAGDRIAHQADVVAESLAGGPVATDWSHALKSGYDVLGLAWPAAGFDALGVPLGALPEVVPPGTVIGATSREAEVLTGLPTGIPIVAGMTDGCAAQIGAASLMPGDRNTVLGTTLVLKAVATTPIADPTGAVYSHRGPDGTWLPGGASNAGAGLLAAFDQHQIEAAMPSVDELWRRGALPVSYPIVGSGERFPFAKQGVSAFVEIDEAVVPLDLETVGSAMFVAAVMAGVACVERLGYQVMSDLGAPDLSAPHLGALGGGPASTGGGSRNPLWNELRATVLGTSVSVPRDADGARGMAMLAAWGVRDSAAGLTLASTATRMASEIDVVDPRETHGFEEELYGRFVGTLQDRGWMP
jgi:sugar (pentulose or hexulose) kinase